jgi:two-component system, OmpR family, alkaline phosphatase synthesis response regulator PhoP
MRKKILIVEDNTELLELLGLEFRQAGFSVVTASDGLEGLKKARTVKPDVVVLDLVLPELDGFELCEALRRDAATAKVPVVILSGLNSAFTRFAGMESGANEYVTKPVSPGHLVSRIRQILSHSPAPAGPRAQEKRRMARRPATA